MTNKYDEFITDTMKANPSDPGWAALEARLIKLVDEEINPFLRSKGREMEQARHITPDVIERLMDAGLMQLLRPLMFGGIEAPMEVMYRVGRRLGYGDGSVSWVYTVANSHDHTIAMYPKHVQEEYWASARPLAASSFIPTGNAAPADGGFTLNGRWGFCSGIDYCDWIIIGGVAPADANSVPTMRYFLVPTSQCRIVDDWHVSAMRATGSKAVFLDDLFVPAERALTDQEVSENKAPGSGLHPSPMFAAPAWTLQGFSIGAAVSGIARAGFDELLTDFRGRYERKEPMIMGKLGAVQTHFSEVKAMLDCSDMFYESALTETFRQVNETRTVTLERRLQNRRDLSYSVLNAKRAVDILLPMAGARYIAEDKLLQRSWRDVGAASTHPALNWDGPALSGGNVLLGGEPTEPRY